MGSEQRERAPLGRAPLAMIVTGDGLNCERETARAFTLAGACCDLVHIGDLLRGERTLEECDVLALIGGFSNGDHLGAGTVQASRFRHSLKADLEGLIDRGAPVIGICNGFQTLVKMGILPGALKGAEAGDPGEAEPGNWPRNATITANDSGKFEDRWVHLVVDPQSPCIWTRGLRRLFLPVRHGEGKFFMAAEEAAETLDRSGQVAARYATAAGVPTQGYPENPNGSQRAIAGICDPSGLIFGLMPHPEACLSPYNHPSWTRELAVGRSLPTEGEGLAIFRNAVDYLHTREAGR